ncbi:MAG: hypothetical protein ACR2JZ_06330 [Candidatus Limnocylindrales bacterium]
MDANRNTLLGEIAADAAIERSSFMVEATTQLRRFMEVHGERLRDLGGLVLIDDDPEYLSVAPDATFRSRTRYQDEATGEWVSETEVIETVGELVELYNPADIYAAFAEAAREEAGLPEEPTAAEGLIDVAGLAPDETMSVGAIGAADAYAGAADEWAATQGDVEAGEPPEGEDDAARRLYDLALTMQERSQVSEARLIEQFENAAEPIAAVLGDFIVVDDDDERLTLRATGTFTAEVVPEDAAGTWRSLNSPDEIVQFYDPTDVFGDLAEALAESFPEVAGEGGDQGAQDGVSSSDTETPA